MNKQVDFWIYGIETDEVVLQLNIFKVRIISNTVESVKTNTSGLSNFVCLIRSINQSELHLNCTEVG